MAARPEPMNATSTHAKLKVSTTLARENAAHVAGGYVTGRLEVDALADKDLGIGVIMVELVGVQELTSRDHSATSTFLHSRRLFQGPGLPPSNAVYPTPIPGATPLPPAYHPARRGRSTFLFRIPLPQTSPASLVFGGSLARVRYELRASVGVVWRGERREVVQRRDVDVVEHYSEEEEGQAEGDGEAVVVGENGKIWAQGRVVGGVVVAGESACVELQVKNHSNKKNTGLVVTLTRSLVLPTGEPGLQISDTLVTVPFRTQEYVIPPGAEGVASLVFDVPAHARGVRGGVFHGDKGGKSTESIFVVQCVVGVRITMGLGSKDLELSLPVRVVHPAALPEIVAPPPLPPQPVYSPPGHAQPYAAVPPYPIQSYLPYGAPTPMPISMSPVPPPQPWYDVQHGQVWFPPPPVQQMYYAPTPPPRPASAGDRPAEPPAAVPGDERGERASRIAQHLRQSTRNRSASPLSSNRAAMPMNPISQPMSLSNHIPLMSVSNPMSNPMPPPPISIPPRASLQLEPVSPRPLLSPKNSFSDDREFKSVRVEALERMADEVGRTAVDLSGDLPIEKDVVLLPKEEVNINKTLPGPPVPSGKFMRPVLTDGEPTESGLDALERRLMADVGTRVKPVSVERPDVRAVLAMPLDIPKREEPEVDSVISSLTLAGEGAAELERRDAETVRGPDSGENRSRSKGKKKTKAAKGRVTAWLGGLEAEEVLEDPPSPSPKLEETPDPRSSGFVSVQTFRSRIIGSRLTATARNPNPADEAKRVADLWQNESLQQPSKAEPATPVIVPAPSNPWKSSRGALNVDPEVKYDIRSARGGRGGRVTAAKEIWASGAVFDKAASAQQKQKPAIPPPPTSKTAAKPTAPTPKSSSPVPPTIPKVISPRSPLAKPGASVPAVSSSYARPTISSTASLARPVVAAAGSGDPAWKRVGRGVAAGPVKMPDEATTSKKPELAFGQARLRDLISKYQTQAG
ncbi:unnamed protein product [Mycena citricolor]|uniref:Arrestin-like N-terminal domain-containing protein n=1 Tax=Mycena citricolor TaxID=2018698 RepID=A0AAD2H809_9AGAR|nr:unnamed protein product [Mycena citricolor]